MKGYTNKTNIEAYLGKDDGVSDAVLETYIETVENIIDGLTDRNFVADTVASARLYDGTGNDLLLVDDCVAITKVEVGLDTYGNDFQEVSATGADRYFVRPNNYSVNSVPITSIELSARDWPAGRQNNRVTAKWGYSASVPADITFAATVFVAGILNFANDPASIQSEKIGEYAVTYVEGSSQWGDFMGAKTILNQYKKLNI
jgi:hypothetical protein